jgi:hypothetical protein
METSYTWKTRFFSNKFEIFQYENPVGEINNRAFTRSASGTLNGKQFLFDIRGFFHQKTNILNASDESVLAEVKINSWKSKASIKYNGKEYIWEHDNFWNTKWNITNENGAIVKYHSLSSHGEITAYTTDEVLIIAGLFIKNYFRQRAATAAAAT